MSVAVLLSVLLALLFSGCGNLYNDFARLRAAEAAQDFYIYTTAGNQVNRFDDMSGTNLVSYDGSLGTPFSNLYDVFVDSSGIYVTDANSQRLYYFTDMAGTGHTEFGGAPSGFVTPGGVAVYGGQIYVADSGVAPVSVVQRYDDILGGNAVEYDGSTGNAFADVYFVNVNANGIYATSSFGGLSRLYRFDDMTGTNQQETDGGFGTWDPRDIAFDSLGRIYVTESSGLLVRFNDITDPAPVAYDGSAGTLFSTLTGVAVDSLDRIYVADNLAGTLYRFDDMTGANQVELDTGGSGSVWAVTVVRR
jgi:hypothetical protein